MTKTDKMRVEYLKKELVDEMDKRWICPQCDGDSTDSAGPCDQCRNPAIIKDSALDRMAQDATPDQV